MKKVKVIFVNTSTKPTNHWKGEGPQLNGDESARMLQATIDEQEIDGYDLMSSNACTADQGLTIGTMLFFKLRESSQS